MLNNNPENLLTSYQNALDFFLEDSLCYMVYTVSQ